jgi:poly-gamma-glutamate synthesis protein (capsule biosynthesis protein)
VSETCTVMLCGDVMLGRGIDQVLRHPGDPALAEAYLHDARQYVDLARTASGPVPSPVDDTWPWGDALSTIRDSRPGALVVNLETSVTRSSEFAPGKRIHYRMAPENLGCLQAAEPDVCVLANNHVMDFGTTGLTQTLRSLHAGGLRTAGAGDDDLSATAPVRLEPNGRRPPIAVLAYAHPSSGVPGSWAATPSRPGVALLPDLSRRTAATVARRVEEEKQRGAIVVLSVHWGSNWGYEVSREQVRFAHRMVDAGVDLVHGHSSHHPRPIEVHAERLVLHGCGDFVNDYEGIGGYEEYRDDLRLLYRLELAPDGRLLTADLVPFRSRRLRLERAGTDDVTWLAAVLDRESRAYGARVRVTSDDILTVVASRR